MPKKSVMAGVLAVSLMSTAHAADRDYAEQERLVSGYEVSQDERKSKAAMRRSKDMARKASYDKRLAHVKAKYEQRRAKYAEQKQRKAEARQRKLEARQAKAAKKR